MSDMTAFIEGLPKAELHIHIEGSLEPEMMFRMAKRNVVELPYASVDDLRAAYDFRNLQDFLDVYYQGSQVLQTEWDFHELTMAYLKKARSQNVLHAEMFFDPQAHTARGVHFSEVIGGIRRAMAEAEERLGISSALIMCFLRHLDAGDAMKTLDMALGYREMIAAVGLDSSEIGHPPSKFTGVFKRARDEGLPAVAHAGEEGPPEYIWESLDLLGAVRIDHGGRALEDAALMKRLARDAVPLTMCPLSNLRLGVVREMKDHPLKAMMEKGLKVTVNSDDPAYFGGYINDNYRAVHEALGLDRDDLFRLARNSFEASFLPTQAKNYMLALLDDYVSRH